MSIYTSKLQEIARYSAKIDNATVKESDFVAMQKLSDSIIDGYNKGYFSLRQRGVLRSAVEMLIDDCRDVLRVNAEVKRISAEIRKERLSELRSAI